MFGWGSKSAKEDASSSVPEPKSKDDYDALYEKTLQLLKEHTSDHDGWKKVSYENGFTLYEKAVEGNDSIHLVKTEGMLNVSPQKAAALVRDTAIESRKRWDTELDFYNVIETISDRILLAHIGFHTPFPVTPRDFSTLRCTAEEDGVYYFWSFSVVSPQIPEDKNSKYVRGIIIVSGFAIKPVEGHDDQCLIVNPNQVDPKGWIPGWVVNLGKGKSLARMTNMKKILENE